MSAIEAKALDILIDFCDDEPLRETARKGLADLRARCRPDDCEVCGEKRAEYGRKVIGHGQDIWEWYCLGCFLNCFCNVCPIFTDNVEAGGGATTDPVRAGQTSNAPPADLPTIHEVKGILKEPSDDD